MHDARHSAAFFFFFFFSAVTGAASACGVEQTKRQALACMSQTAGKSKGQASPKGRQTLRAGIRS